MKAALVFLMLVVAPIFVLPGVGAFLVILAIGLPATIAALPREKPSRLDPAIWSAEPAELERRYADAMGNWRAGR